jgi:hypothetical protein
MRDGDVLNIPAFDVLRFSTRIYVHWLIWRWTPAAGPWRQGTRTSWTRCSLRAHLCEVEIRARIIALHYGFPHFALRQDAVEDNAVEAHVEDLDDDLDETADECPVLRRLLGKLQKTSQGISSLPVDGRRAHTICRAQRDGVACYPHKTNSIDPCCCYGPCLGAAPQPRQPT